MNAVEPQVHLWTRDEYYAMGEAGLFEGKHVELIEGQVIEMSPIGSRHFTTVSLAARILSQAFGAGWYVRMQGPLDLGALSEPEPDLAVVPGDILDYKGAHPTSAALIVEVAESSLAYDRMEKASLYARAGIEDYWIINLPGGQLEVLRQPVQSTEYVYGFGYAERVVLRAEDSVSPLAKSDAVFNVADLLP